MKRAEQDQRKTKWKRARRKFSLKRKTEIEDMNKKNVYYGLTEWEEEEEQE